MKRLSLLLIAFLACGLTMLADGLKAFGLKGKVKEANTTVDVYREGPVENSFRFDENGELKSSIFLPDCGGGFIVNDLMRSQTGYTGTYYGGKVTLKVTNGRLTSATYKEEDRDASHTITYAYNAEGLLASIKHVTKVTSTEAVRNEGSAKVNTNDYEKYYKLAKQATEKGDAAAAKKYSQLASAAAKKANVSVKQSTVSQQKNTKTYTSNCTYTYQKKDAKGNWTKRTRKMDGYSYEETQQITYYDEPAATSSATSATSASNSNSDVAANESGEIRDVVEVNASFPGGDAQIFSFIASNLRYPPICQEKGIQGRVIVQFIVEVDGSLSNIEVTRSPDENLSKEAIRVIKMMPKWNPAKQGGKNVRARYNLPVMFRLG